MSKPPIRRVPSDDCVVTVDGVEYRPHEGEYVEIAGKPSIGALQALWHFRKSAKAPQEEPPEGASAAALSEYNDRSIGRISEQFDALCEVIARHVTGWNWTDGRGVPLPQPDGTPTPIKALESEELYWLESAIQGQTSAARKNALKPSAPTSATRARSRTKRS